MNVMLTESNSSQSLDVHFVLRTAASTSLQTVVYVIKITQMASTTVYCIKEWEINYI